MPNAKILLELPGVEAGSKECGECEQRTLYREWACDCFDRITLMANEWDETLRCPACLAAEVKVPDCPTLADLGYHILRKLGFDGLYLGKTCSCGEKGNLMDKCSADLSYPPKCRAGYRQPDGTIGPKKEKS